MTIDTDVMARARRADYRPPAPQPPVGRLGPLALYRALRANAITAWRDQAFEEPLIADRNRLGGYVLVNDPDLIRRVLIDNAANYPKDDLQLEKLTPAIGRGLLTAEPESWRLQRRTVAPLFQPAAVESYLAPMAASVDEMLAGWEAHAQSGAVVDIAHEMTNLTYDIISRTVFSHEIETPAAGDGRGDHDLFRCARAHRPVGRAAVAALAAAPGLHPRAAGAEDLSRGGGAAAAAPPRAHRGGQRCRAIWWRG